MSSLLLLLSALYTTSQSQPIQVTGFIVDLWCWDDNNKKALDTGASMLTDPGNHKIYCMWDVSFCKESGFAFVYQPTNDSDYELQYLLDTEGNTAAITAMKAFGRNQKYFQFTWTGIPDIATADDCSPGANDDWYCEGRPILRTTTAFPSTSPTTAAPSTSNPTGEPTPPTENPTAAPVVRGRSCQLDDIIYGDGESTGYIGYTCNSPGDYNDTTYIGKESICRDGTVVSVDYDGDCGRVGEGWFCCQRGDVGTRGGAVCVTECLVIQSNVNGYIIGGCIMTVLSVIFSM